MSKYNVHTEHRTNSCFLGLIKQFAQVKKQKYVYFTILQQLL